MDFKLTTAIVWNISKEWSLTGEFNWVSGRHYTPVILGKTFWYMNNNNEIIFVPRYGKYNSMRYGDDHNLNFKMEYSGLFFDLPGKIFLQVNNIYNNRPVIAYNYNYDFSLKEEVRNPLGIYGLIGIKIEW